MASGLKSGGVDLDSLFMARINGATPRAGYSVLGVEISDRYEVRAGAAARAAVGIKIAGVDISQYYCPYGTHRLVAGLNDFGGAEFDVGYTSGAFGSVQSTSVFGSAIRTIRDTNSATDASKGFWVQLTGTRARTFFSTVTCNGVTYPTSTATFTSGPNAMWRWMGAGMPSGMVNGGIYPVTFLA